MQIANPEDPDFTARPRTGDWAALPDTSGESWHFFKHETRVPGVLSLTQTFTEDTVYVTNRIPYTPKYNENYLASLRGNPYVEVVEIGKSREGRPLELVKTRGSGADEQKKPCVLIYAREHCDEQDGSWVAQGAIDFLASSDPQARKARSECTFLIIPLLDPDGAAAGRHGNITSRFAPGNEGMESLEYAEWFKNWVDDGRRLDVSLSIHDPAPVAAFHVACPIMEPRPKRLAADEALHKKIRADLIAAGFTVRETPWVKGLDVSRLSGWISEYYGTLPLPYEVNSLTPRRELSLEEVSRIGKIMVAGAAEYIQSPSARPLLDDIGMTRRQRADAWRQFGRSAPKGNAIEAEHSCLAQLRESEIAVGTTQRGVQASVDAQLEDSAARK